MLASLLFPYDNDAPGLIDDWLDELEAEDCILRYCDENQSSYIEICHWRSHQKIDKPSNSKLPAPDSSNTREHSRGLDEHSRKIAQDQGPRTKERTKDHGEDQGMDLDHSLSVSEAENGRCKYSAEFEYFWNAYPKQRRTKKQDAYRKWKQALRQADASMLIQRAKDYAHSEQGQSEYAVMPSVWLNGAMWEDEPEAWARGIAGKAVAF